MSTKAQLGILSNLYNNTGSYGSPTLNAVSLVSDCTVGGEWDKGDASTRASRAKLQNKTMIALSVSGKVKADLSDANYVLFMNALANDAVVNIVALNGAMTLNGARGWMYDSQMFKGNEDQGLGSVVFTEFEFVPANTGNPPQQVTVAAGAPVYTPV